MKAAHEIFRITDPVDGFLAHAGHDAHADRDISRIRDLDAGFGVGRLGMTHHIRHDIHGPAFHAAVEKRGHLFFGFLGIHPVVVRPGGLLIRVTDKGQLLGAGDIIGMGIVEIGVRPLRVIEFFKDRLSVQLFFFFSDLDELSGFGFRTIAPVDLGGFRQFRYFFYPFFKWCRHF